DVSEAVAKADRYDAAGNHVEAVNQLAVGARRKDVEALTRLGKRLLVGDRAPRLPNDGARFIEDAFGLGGAEAAAVLSVLYAVGASRRHGLPHSLSRLTDAAERGWPSAQAQLRLLASERFGANGTNFDIVGSDWRRLASGIDLEAWQASPPGSDLAPSPLIRVIPDFINAETCGWLIEKARGRLSRARVYEAVIKKT